MRYLQVIHGHKNDASLNPRVRKKYETTWKFLQKQYGGFMSALETSGFNPKAICRCDWREPLRRIGTADGFFG